MRSTYDKLAASRPDWKKCNRDQVTQVIQRAAEPHFNHKFGNTAPASKFIYRVYSRSCNWPR